MDTTLGKLRKTGAAMTELLLQPTGEPDDHEVVVAGQLVGRIVLLAGAWSWAIDTAFRPGRHPVYGFEPTRDAARQRSREAGFSAVKAPRGAASLDQAAFGDEICGRRCCNRKGRHGVRSRRARA
jgi:hypothetical protein